MGRFLAGMLVLVGCGGSAGSVTEPTPSTGSAGGEGPRAASCPATATAPSPLPHVKPEYRTLAYWLAHTPDLDDVVLDPNGVRDLNTALAVSRGSDWHGEEDLTASVDKAHVVKDTASRLEDQFQKLSKGELVEKDGAKVAPADVAMFDPKKAGGLTVLPELRVALDAVPIRCGPRELGFFSKPAHAGDAPNTRFDRDACSTAHAQEVIQILAQWPNGMKLARTRYATGWIAANARLSPPIPDALRESYVHGARVQIDDDLAPQTTGVAAQCPAGTLLPLASGNRVRVAGADGFHETDIPEGHIQPTRRPLTRRALLTEAFHFIDTPYGWGGEGGHDCSGFLMDLFGAFDIHLPRHSAWQTRAGSFSIDVTKVPLASERMRLIDAAAKKGIVLLGFPGHIMLYLGRNDAGTPMVMHALAEYVTPCAGGGETINQIDRITVSDLELGRGSSRTALIERITRIAVIGGAPGNELSGAAELRPAAPLVAPPPAKLCKDSQEVAIYASPRRPNAKQPMRVIATANHDPGAVELALFDGKGERVAVPNVVHLNGPPWGTIATIDAPAAGTYTAVLGDGVRVEACLRIAVGPRAPGTGGAAPPTAPTWEVQRSWTRATENLYSTFVQRLFDFPADQEVTWPDLQTLIKDPAHNILLDHLQKNEDQILKLRPDCADLPFVLRAYFAWKMGLPYGFHRCSRGTPTSPPVCKEKFQTNLMTRDLLDQRPTDFDELLPGEEDPKGVKTPPVPPPPPDPKAKPIPDVNAFAMFWGRHVANTVHSATGRTLPGDDNTDYYPIPLGRESLRPGAVYIDPFGHVMIVAGWIPQTASTYGVLFAADGQPDGTVGRKRFWRGNFLFTTETKVSGAGFKAFRPALYHYATKSITLMKNSELKRARMFTPFSTQQYEGTVDTFHDTMEALINPRPLDAAAAMTVLVDALHQQARLRVISVKNGEDWVAKNPGATMPMPEGAAIFLAAGAWEDFATPSRDFRLLIAIDTVLAFPATVKRAPQRFGLEAGPALEATVKKLEADLDKMLRARTIEYVRSDGSKQTLSLHDLVERHAGFEVSYNPNDCAEFRWGAPAGSQEMATCQRHSPTEQSAKMEKYRVWFRDRKRPAR